MDNKTLFKFIKFIEKNVMPTIKKDFNWLSKIITADLERLTKKKKPFKKKDE